MALPGLQAFYPNQRLLTLCHILLNPTIHSWYSVHHILQAMSLLENVDEEDHERTLEALIDGYDAPNTDYELLDSIECDKELEDVDSDKNPAAQVRPIKHTHTHATSATSINLYTVITGVGMIGREGSRTISGRRITQEIPGRKVVTHRNMSILTHVPKS